MGRYYFGTISGKFVGNQGADDIKFFKSPIIFSAPLRCYEYMKCSCFVKDIYSLYCINCYDSLEHQMEDFDEDDVDEYKANGGLIYESCLVKFNFDKYELEYIQNKLKELEEKINKNSKIDIIKKLNINIFNNSKSKKNKTDSSETDSSETDSSETDSSDDEPSFEYSINDDGMNFSDKKYKYILTWCIGKQIEHSLKELGYSEIYCED